MRLAKTVMCGGATVLLLFSSVLATSPSLHHFFHHDSDSPTHTCLATMFAAGQVLASDSCVAVAFFVAGILVLAAVEVPANPLERDLRLPAGRAPPLV